MKKILSIAAALSVAATAAFANADYSLRIVSNGVTYQCLPQTEIVRGQEAYRCIRPGAGGGDLFSGGIGTAGGIGLGLLGIIVLATALEDDDDTTNGTN